jgi:hypothetical protein
MRVGVEDTVDDDLPQQAVEQVAGQPLAVAVGRPGLAQRLPVEQFHDEHPPGAQVVVGTRDHYPVRVSGGANGGEIPRLDPEVQFLAQRGGEALGQLRHSDRPGPPHPHLGAAGQPGDDVQVAFDQAGHAGAADLDHHSLAGTQRGRVHLGDGGRCQRIGVDLGEHAGAAEFLAEHPLDLGPGQRADPVLQPAELAGELRRQQVPAGGQGLAELHEHHAAAVQRLGQRPGQRDRPGPLGCPAQRPDPAAGEDTHDLPVAAAAGRARAQAARPAGRRRYGPGRDEGLPGDQDRHRQQQAAGPAERGEAEHHAVGG